MGLLTEIKQLSSFGGLPNAPEEQSALNGEPPFPAPFGRLYRLKERGHDAVYAKIKS